MPDKKDLEGLYRERSRMYYRMARNGKLYKDKKEAVQRCEQYRFELYGMLDLLESAGVFNWEQKEKERDQVMENLSALKLYGVSVDWKAEIYCYGPGEVEGV